MWTMKSSSRAIVIIFISPVVDSSRILERVYPTIPIISPPTASTMLLVNSPSIAGSLLASMLAQTTWASRSFRNVVSPSGPLSNSWFPKACED